MKKTIFIILAAGLALTAVLGSIYIYKMKTAAVLIEEIIPANAVAYGHVSNIEKRLQELRKTQLCRNIKNIDVEMVMETSGFPPKMIRQYQTFKSEWTAFITGLVADKFFGQEIALAIYANDIKNIDRSSPKAAMLDFASNIILVTRLKPEAEFIDIISGIYKKFNQDVNIKHETYKNHKITLIELADEVYISYVKIKDLLVISLTTKGTHLCIDAFSKDKTSLAQDKDFILTMAKLPKSAHLTGYGNLKLFIPNIENILDAVSDSNIPAVTRKILSKNFTQFSGLETVGFASLSGNISKTKYILTFDKNNLDARIAKIYSVKPQENKTINFIPKNIIGYHWVNFFDLKSTLDNIRESANRSKQSANIPSPDYFTKGLEEKSGLSIEADIIPALGNEMGGFLSDINLSGPFPVPQILFFVEVENIPASENIMTVLTEKNNIFLQTESYKNVPVKYMVLPFGANIQPAYCFLDNYLLIAVSRSLLKKSIDAYHNDSLSLREDTDFKTVNFGLTGKNNSISFLKMDLLLDRVKKIAEWGFSCYSMVSSMAGTRNKQIESSLAELETALQQKTERLEHQKDKLALLKKESESLRTQGLDASLKEKESAVETGIKAAETEVESLQKDIETKRKSKQAGPLAGGINVASVRIILDEIAYPILDGLKMYKTTGSRVIFGQDVIESQSFTNIEE